MPRWVDRDQAAALVEAAHAGAISREVLRQELSAPDGCGAPHASGQLHEGSYGHGPGECACYSCEQKVRPFADRWADPISGVGYWNEDGDPCEAPGFMPETNESAMAAGRLGMLNGKDVVRTRPGQRWSGEVVVDPHAEDFEAGLKAAIEDSRTVPLVDWQGRVRSIKPGIDHPHRRRRSTSDAQASLDAAKDARDRALEARDVAVACATEAKALAAHARAKANPLPGTRSTPTLGYRIARLLLRGRAWQLYCGDYFVRHPLPPRAP